LTVYAYRPLCIISACNPITDGSLIPVSPLFQVELLNDKQLVTPACVFVSDESAGICIKV
jgi:hypothetical protein